MNTASGRLGLGFVGQWRAWRGLRPCLTQTIRTELTGHKQLKQFLRILFLTFLNKYIIFDLIKLLGWALAPVQRSFFVLLTKIRLASFQFSLFSVIILSDIK